MRAATLAGPDSADNSPGPATLSGGVVGDSLPPRDTRRRRSRFPGEAGLRRERRRHALHFAAVSGDRITLEVKERGADQLGTRNVKRLRRQGLIPGVLYGKANKAFVVGERELRIALTGPSGLHGIVDVVIEGQKTPHHAVLKDYQQHPVRGTITHVDFHEVRLDQPIQATVAVQLVGEAPGAKVGGVVSRSTESFTSRRSRRISLSTSRSTSAASSSATRCACRTSPRSLV